MQGWFHGHGVFWRSDGMKFEGEFRGGRIWGLGKCIILLDLLYKIKFEPRTGWKFLVTHQSKEGVMWHVR